MDDEARTCKNKESERAGDVRRRFEKTIFGTNYKSAFDNSGDGTRLDAFRSSTALNKTGDAYAHQPKERTTTPLWWRADEEDADEDYS